MHRAPQKSGGGNPMVSSLLVGGRWWNERAYVGGWVDGQKKINKACIIYLVDSFLLLYLKKYLPSQQIFFC